jgi:hypothetical protein
MVAERISATTGYPGSRRSHHDPGYTWMPLKDSSRYFQTLTMHMRRFTHLTNAFSKKVEHYAHAVALHMMYYNFVRIHQTLKVTPAMAAGVTKRLWEMGDIVGVLEAWEACKRPS